MEAAYSNVAKPAGCDHVRYTLRLLKQNTVGSGPTNQRPELGEGVNREGVPRGFEFSELAVLINVRGRARAFSNLGRVPRHAWRRMAPPARL